jgi:hypothetical protein
MKPIAYLCAAAIMAAALPASATPPSDLADLVGLKDTSAVKSLDRRGYDNVGATGEAQYWFNPETKLCVKTVAVEGKMKAVDAVKGDVCKSLTPGDQANAQTPDADKKR